MEEKSKGKKKKLTLDEKLKIAGTAVGIVTIIGTYAYGFYCGKRYEDAVFDDGMNNLVRDGFLKMTDPNTGERLSLNQWGRAINEFYRRNK